ncbi:MAG TPA: hypothetical protein VN924_17465 [Bryobacteraceae bacterium]|nr:hypothetical protein [Bryobacteraceae bacterium]
MAQIAVSMRSPRRFVGFFDAFAQAPVRGAGLLRELVDAGADLVDARAELVVYLGDAMVSSWIWFWVSRHRARSVSH